jgi:hypothetical protein
MKFLVELYSAAVSGLLALPGSLVPIYPLLRFNAAAHLLIFIDIYGRRLFVATSPLGSCEWMMRRTIIELLGGLQVEIFNRSYGLSLQMVNCASIFNTRLYCVDNVCHRSVN